MSRLYANENFPLSAVEDLRQLGHDVLTSLEAGRAGQAIPDEDVLEFATSADRAVLTFNRRDFIRLHAIMPAHAGVVVCTVDADSVALAERIDRALAGLPNLRGQLVRIHRLPS